MIVINTRSQVILFTLLVTAVMGSIGLFILSYKVETPFLFEKHFPGSEIQWQAKYSEFVAVNASSVELAANNEAQNRLTFLVY